MAQAYLPEVREGDKRILLLDGEPIGCVLRVPRDDETRANLHVGGTRRARPRSTRATRRSCATIAPQAARRRPLLRRHRRHRRLADRGQRHLADGHSGDRPSRRRAARIARDRLAGESGQIRAHGDVERGCHFCGCCWRSPSPPAPSRTPTISRRRTTGASSRRGSRRAAARCSGITSFRCGTRGPAAGRSTSPIRSRSSPRRRSRWCSCSAPRSAPSSRSSPTTSAPSTACIASRAATRSALPSSILAAILFGTGGWLALHFAEGHCTFFGAALFPYAMYFYRRARDEFEWCIPLGFIAAWIVGDGGTSTPPMCMVILATLAAIGLRSRAARCVRSCRSRPPPASPLPSVRCASCPRSSSPSIIRAICSRPTPTIPWQMVRNALLVEGHRAGARQALLVPRVRLAAAVSDDSAVDLGRCA